jgi:energy-converting hydrogenase Eha subunit C
MFTIGGLSGVVLANASLDIAFHDKLLVFFSTIILLPSDNELKVEKKVYNAEYIKMF